MKFIAFKAGDGDSVLIQGNQANILVDGGRKTPFVDHVAPELAQLHQADKELDLVCVSHIDDDHITGIVELYRRRTAWAVHNLLLADGEPTDEPPFDEPPVIRRLWHNGFGETFQAAAAAVEGQLDLHSQILSASASLADTEYDLAFGRLAQGAKLAIRLQLNFAQSPMNIELNGPTSGQLLQVADPAEPTGIKGVTVHLLGPFEDDFARARHDWDEWVTANQQTIEDMKEEFGQQSPGNTSALEFLAFAATKFSEFGDLGGISPPNLASIMFLLVEGNQTILMTGDGSAQAILEGLEHAGQMQPGGDLHVNILKVQHHGAKANMMPEFVKRLTADDYVFCANGRHHNPESDVITAIVKSRLGDAAVRTTNPDADGRFKLWFNYHPDDTDIEDNQNYIDQLNAAKTTIDGLLAEHPDGFDFEFSQGSSLTIDLD
jgi:beta-lactamase superfamily II metal-dependent hydrolase